MTRLYEKEYWRASLDVSRSYALMISIDFFFISASFDILELLSISHVFSSVFQVDKNTPI